MEYTIGQVVYSKKGRDKGLPFLVFKVEGDYLYLADGKVRKINKLKKKKCRHVQPTNNIILEFKNSIENNLFLTDSDIRKYLLESLS